METKIIHLTTTILRFTPLWFVSEILKRYCRESWKEGKTKRHYIETIENLLNNR